MSFFKNIFNYLCYYVRLSASIFSKERKKKKAAGWSWLNGSVAKSSPRLRLDPIWVLHHALVLLLSSQFPACDLEKAAENGTKLWDPVHTLLWETQKKLLDPDFRQVLLQALQLFGE